MATITSEAKTPRTRQESNPSIAKDVLVALGSLKLTVALFALSLVIVLVGTLAQDEMNMLEVKQRYFLSWIAPLHIDDFFPQAFYPHEEPIPGRIPFPGGALIGLLLMINLVAAKATRFRINSSGTRLVAGVGVILAGILLAGIVISAGHSSDGLQGVPPMEYTTLWAGVLASLTVLAIGLGAAGSRVSNSTIRSLAWFGAAVCAAFIAYCLFTGFRIGDPGLRIVWQLTKGLGAGVVMLIGCIMVFDRQGGNVLLHAGVGLLMLGQFVFGDRQLEQRLNLIEGQSANTLVNLDRVEMTLIREGDDEQKVTAIPASRMLAVAGTDQLITDDALPVDVKVLEFYENSDIRDGASDPELANAGNGLRANAVRTLKSGGTDSKVNLASAYVELIDKDSGDSKGKYLVSQLLSDIAVLIPDGSAKDVYDTIDIDGNSYLIGLRLHREVKPYWIQLEDVRQVNYSGTAQTRDYSSYIRIVDPETGEDRRERVWMNNPLRYRGETFYQSNYTALPGGKEMTGIQVVRNSGWLIPYVACSITALGMLAHFFGTLTRFLKRRERETRKESVSEAAPETKPDFMPGPNRSGVIAVGMYALLAVVCLVPWQAVRNRMRPTDRVTKFDFYEAGKIPTSYGGRVMPLDAYARQALKSISNRESLKLDTAPPGIQTRVAGGGDSASDKVAAAKASKRGKLSAMQWLMEVAIDSEELRFLPMFRIDAEEVRAEMGLPRRKSKLYSLDEFSQKWMELRPQVDRAKEKDAKERTFKERKLVEFDRRVSQYLLTTASFGLPVPEVISKEEFEKVFPGASDRDREMFALRDLERRMNAVKNMTSPAIVAPAESTISNDTVDPRWEAFGPAFFDYYSDLARTGEDDDPPTPRAGVETFSKMIKSYGDGDTEKFNEAVDTHLADVAAFSIPGYSTRLVGVERWMQSNWPTGVAMFLYLITLVMGLVYLAVDSPGLRNATWGALLVAVSVHTLAIVCRIAITGRAPVINIYSSAVFIGWASVVFCMILERIFRYGIGNVLASAAGLLTLLVAYGLNTGDTMPVLEAVLDTQFWLSTHVISVTLGYVATLIAGTLGIGYLVASWFGCSKKTLHDIYRCCYGTACFGILFSFVGTVLGGLWADDSWGRFWGWDPKENGALLIVIWNALMLHARWDGMVGPRGFSLLAIGGNVVTAWSWFGTNELGIGLHSYGFTSGVLMWLTVFIATQFAFIIADFVARFIGVGSAGTSST